MQKYELFELVHDFFLLEGWDFFMIDPSTKLLRGAPFHIEEERDLRFFAENASTVIAWTPVKNKAWSDAVRTRSENF